MDKNTTPIRDMPEDEFWCPECQKERLGEESLFVSFKIVCKRHADQVFGAILKD